ncbi:MAG: leuD [Rhodospirillales bacterium]|jgi:3-isopropylmalate/(R)-2-methylmalate dehydratase small subunit|nr:leuD [Rhodospirillales bacterium]
MPSLIEVAGPAAPMLTPNINTDAIAPLYRPATAGSPRPFTQTDEERAKNLFAGLRYDLADDELPDFVLNRPPFRSAKFILALDNFACGSSRESAVWYLYAFGIRCVVAPSFGEIFFDNCFKNGLLPLVLDAATIRELAAEAATGADFTLDVRRATLTAPSGRTIEFTLSDFRREALLTGADEIAMTQRREAAIAAHQERQRRERPWVLRESAK